MIQTKDRVILVVKNTKFTKLLPILMYFRSLIAMFEKTSISNSVREEQAGLVLNLCKNHISFEELTLDEIVQFFYEFEHGKNCHEVRMLRFKFLEELLPSEISPQLATALHELFKNWKAELIVELLSKIRWSALAIENDEITPLIEKFDLPKVWEWVLKNNNERQRFTRNQLLELAQKAKNFPQGTLIEWSKTPVAT